MSGLIRIVALRRISTNSAGDTLPLNLAKRIRQSRLFT